MLGVYEIKIMLRIRDVKYEEILEESLDIFDCTWCHLIKPINIEDFVIKFVSIKDNEWHGHYICSCKEHAYKFRYIKLKKETNLYILTYPIFHLRKESTVNCQVCNKKYLKKEVYLIKDPDDGKERFTELCYNSKCLEYWKLLQC